MRFALLFLLTLPTVALAGDWTNWRGPHGNGVADGSGYPTEWSETKHITWQAELPGPGGSTPIVHEEKIFVTAVGDNENIALCFDPRGHKVWETAIGTKRAGKHNKGTGANPSPVTDGKHLWCYYKSGDLACLDLEGNLVWQKNLQEMYGKDTLWWDLGTSPVLTEKYVVVAVMQTGPSYLVALEKESGKVAWKQDRDLGAPVEAAQSYTTPLVYNYDGEERILVLGADHVTAHRAADGKQLWMVGGMNPEQNKYFRSISSPVIVGEYVVAPYARGNTLTAIRLGGAGDVSKSHVVWSIKGKFADVPTPTVHENKIYICSDTGQMSCVDVKSGYIIWSERLEKHRSKYSSSPVIADGKLYMTREDATTFVLQPGDEFKLLAKNELEDQKTVSTPVPVNGNIYLRTFKKLYCISK